MTVRVHQDDVEVLSTGAPAARVDQVVLEVVVNERLVAYPSVYQEVIELPRTTMSAVIVDQLVLEVVGPGLTYYNPCWTPPPRNKPFGFVSIRPPGPCPCRQL